MFKGKIHIYRNTGGKEEEVMKNFDNEEDFNRFIEQNPDLKSFREWTPIKWPALANFRDLFAESEKSGGLSEEIREDLGKMEENMKSLFERSKNLLKK